MAMILEAFVKVFIERLASLINNEVEMMLEIRRELRNLHGKMSLIIGVLEDAEKKAMVDPVLHQWVIQLRDVMYDADDIIDEYQTRTSLVRPNLPLLSSCFGQLLIRHSIGRRIKSINKRLKEVNKNRAQFQLQSSSTSSVPDGQSSRISRITSPLVESDIVGMKIDEDARKLVHKLAKETQEGIQVFAITGMGGVGKTTLAQIIYNNKVIADNFPLKAWVCVTKEFTETGVLRDILSDLRIGHHEARSKTQLEPMLENAIRDKKYLIILDDVWSTQVWTDLLRNPLQSGACGSRVLITTRNEGVARGMNATHIHPVKLMSPEEGWALLCKKVALGGEEREMEDLEDVGKLIVEKCCGLPLAIKTVGGVLCTKDRTRQAWEEILKRSAWSLSNLPEGVGGALYLSYEDLPSHLKQCFLYCSLFPNNFCLCRAIIVRKWISEGLVRTEGDTMLEVIAERYFRELVQRSLLQPRPGYYLQDVFTMHDLMRSLALFIARDEMLVMGDAWERMEGSSLVKLRRLCFVISKEKSKAVLDATKGHDSLRTLMLSGLQLEENDVNDVIKNKKHLRAFTVENTRIKRLPKSLGVLVHLRYLGICDSDINELPETVSSLVNLQYLILFQCKKLRSLPRGIGKLRNLRSLALDCMALEAIPTEVGRLHNLDMLAGFVVNNCRWGAQRSRDGWCTLDGLRSLTRLRLLNIQKLESAWTEAAVRQGSVLENMMNLEDLCLKCTPPSEAGYGEEETKRIEEVFEVALCPSPSLQFLGILDFFGLHYPSWMANSSLLQNLRLLYLVNCIKWVQLPPLGELPSLDFLRIEGASGVVTIGPNFLGSEAYRGERRVLFPKLTMLYLDNMPNWEQWQWEEEEELGIKAFPCLKMLHLNDCPKLRCLPAGLGHHATRLTDLIIQNCGSLETLGGISNLRSLESLRFADGTIESLPQPFSGGEEEHSPQLLTLEKPEIIAGSQLFERGLMDGPDWPKIQHLPYMNMQGRGIFKIIRKAPSSFNINVDDGEQDMEDNDDA